MNEAAMPPAEAGQPEHGGPHGRGPLYPERDHAAQGAHYLRHVDAMTREGLHAKSRIAGELAARDIEIERLRAAGHKLVEAYRDRYRKKSTAGLRSDAPLYSEFAEFNGALQDKANPR